MSGVVPIKLPWTEKPPPGTPIDLSHPMAKDLFFFCACDRVGDQVDLVNNKKGATIGSNFLTTRKPTPDGLSFNIEWVNNSTEAGFDFGNTGGSGVYEPTELTIIARATCGDEVDNGFSRIVSKRSSSGTSDDFTIFLDNDPTLLGFRINGVQDEITATGGGDWFNTRMDVALAVDSVGQDNYVWDYTNNVFLDNVGQTGATVDQSTNNLALGHRSTNDRTWDGDIHFVSLFNKKKSFEFINTFRLNPWQIFEPRIIWIPVPTDAVAAEFQVLAQMSLNVTGDLQTAINFASSANLSLITIADLATAIPMQATPDMSLAAAIELSTAIEMAATPPMNLNAAAALDTAIPLQAAPSMSLVTASALTTVIQMKAAPIMSLNAAAALLTAIQMAAGPTNMTLNMAAALTAAPDTTMAATPNMSLVSAALLQTAIQLKATPAMSLSGVAALNTAIELRAASNMSLSVSVALATAIEMQVTASMALFVNADLDAGAIAVPGKMADPSIRVSRQKRWGKQKHPAWREMEARLILEYQHQLETVKPVEVEQPGDYLQALITQRDQVQDDIVALEARMEDLAGAQADDHVVKTVIELDIEMAQQFLEFARWRKIRQSQLIAAIEVAILYYYY